MPQALPSPEPDRPPQDLFQPAQRRPTVGDAMRRYWLLIVVVVVAAGAVGAYLGYSRPPQYEATTSLSVGLMDLSTQSVPGFAVGGEVVAAGYSRSIQSPNVVQPVAQRLKMTPGAVRSHVTATPVPNSPIFMVKATASSAAAAVTLANAVGDSMVAYGANRSAAGPELARLIASYRAAIRRRDQARSRLASLRAGTPAPGAIGNARADLETAEVRADTAKQIYQERAAGPRNNAAVQPLATAEGASSDRRSRTQLYGAVGALAGLCLGTALAVLLTGRRFRRLAS
jgi:uncharacterized protein involved in exopolysaccharide biosynthesis